MDQQSGESEEKEVMCKGISDYEMEELVPELLMMNRRTYVAARQFYTVL